MERIFLLDKPVGPTSHDMVDALRAALGTRRIGHTGTLDPMASGLLVMLTGRATKLAELFREHDKLYRGKVSFGTSTETDDREGRVLQSLTEFDLDEPALLAAIAELASRSEQRTPAYSAVKVSGVPLYKQARMGLEVKPPMRPVKIHRMELLSLQENEAEIEVECSSGTYVRALARDLGEILGIPSHLSGLRRFRSGPFHVKDALSLAEIQDSGREAPSLSVDLAFGHLPSATIHPDYLPRLQHGNQPGEADLELQGPLPPLGTWVALRDGEGNLKALARVEDDLEGPHLKLRRSLGIGE